MSKFKLKQAVILAGGEGIRLRPLTLATPKPMIKIQGKPFLEYVIKLLVENKIQDVIILVGYLHEKIEKYFGDGRKFGVKIRYSYSPTETDTGVRIRNVKKMLDDTFLLLYGDNYWPLKLKELLNFYEKAGSPYLVTAYANLDKLTKNNILINQKGVVEIYDRSRQTLGLNGVDIGFFILRKSIISFITGKNPSLEKTTLTNLIKKNKFSGFLTHHQYYSLTDVSRLPAIEKYFRKRKVVFLDRDGVINKKSPKAQYITSWREFKFLPKAKKALKLLSKKKYEIYIISNQAGIARGMVTKKQIDFINGRLVNELKKIGVSISGIYICPHGWNEGCFCRKPSPGLFFMAASENNINLYDSYCVGDDDRDTIAGKLAGCKTYSVNRRKSLYSVVNKYL